MENELFNERFSIDNFIDGLRKQLRVDYLRLIEYCAREIKRCQSERKILPKNPPANMSEEELKKALLINEGEEIALERMHEYIQKRL